MTEITRLPEAEYEIMQIVWSEETPISSKQVAVLACPVFNWKIQTVLTLLGRLTKRGFLESEKRGKELYHTPLISREEYLKMETGLFVQKFHKNSVTGLMSALFSDENPTEAELDELEKWLKERK